MFAMLRRLHTRLGRPVDDRKLRFFALYCCRLVCPALTDERSRKAVDVAERFLAGLANSDELTVAIQEAHAARTDAVTAYEFDTRTSLLGARQAALVAAWVVDRGYHQSVISKVRDALAFHGEIQGKADIEALLAKMADALREIFGNPLRPVTLDPAWLTSDVLALARQMYESREFPTMPILADALQDAGCDNDDVLTHCRDANTTHVRGCWVVDLVLGKQ